MTNPAEDSGSILVQLAAVIASRQKERPSGSYVVELLDGGPGVIGSKVVEEAYELVSAVAEEHSGMDVIHETADLMFHVLVLLESAGVSWKHVEQELVNRFGVSGLTVRKSRMEDAS